VDLFTPFEDGPDLREPAVHLRIVPGRYAGEPHLLGSIRLTEARDADWTDAEAELGRSFSDRQPYPPGHPYLVRSISPRVIDRRAGTSLSGALTASLSAIRGTRSCG
jgi:hypothetical protein